MDEIRAIENLAFLQLVMIFVILLLFTGALLRNHYLLILGAYETSMGAEDAILANGDLSLHLELRFIDRRNALLVGKLC